MATTIDATKIFTGAPISATFGGVEAGATISVPKFEIAVDSGAPQFTNAGGPVMGTQINRRAVASITLEINEITDEKLGWAMPGMTAGTWTLGRIASDQYKTLIVTQAGADGSILTVTLLNALSAENQSYDFSDDPAKPGGLQLKFTAFYDQATPMVAPFSMIIA